MPVWRRSQDVAVVNSGDRTVVLNLADLSSVPSVLEGSADQIWRLVDGQHSVEEIAANLADTFGVSAQEIGPDVAAFLEQLAEGGFVERVDPDPRDAT